MKVSGFSFIRNAIKYDYPIVESIKSILPLCDDFVVAVGKSEDDTQKLIELIDPKKIQIIKTEWNDDLREGGKVLAEETNKAFQAIDDSSTWAFYIQGDEVVHEKYHETIQSTMKKWAHNTRVDGLLFKYMHFYGSYDYVGDSSKWYDQEIRIIRNDKSIYSYKDAQGFRKATSSKLNVKEIDAYVYHYGWVKEPTAMQRKQEDFNKLWHDDTWIDKNIPDTEDFDYTNIDSLKKFEGTHPKVMQARIDSINWKFNFDPSRKKFKLKEKLKRVLKDYLGLDFSYRNYKII